MAMQAPNEHSWCRALPWFVRQEILHRADLKQYVPGDTVSLSDGTMRCVISGRFSVATMHDAPVGTQLVPPPLHPAIGTRVHGGAKRASEHQVAAPLCGSAVPSSARVLTPLSADSAVDACIEACMPSTAGSRAASGSLCADTRSESPPAYFAADSAPAHKDDALGVSTGVQGAAAATESPPDSGTSVDDQACMVGMHVSASCETPSHDSVRCKTVTYRDLPSDLPSLLPKASGESPVLACMGSAGGSGQMTPVATNAAAEHMHDNHGKTVATTAESTSDGVQQTGDVPVAEAPLGMRCVSTSCCSAYGSHAYTLYLHV